MRSMRCAVLMVAVLAAVTVAAHASPNLVQNGSFEDPNVGSGWSASAAPYWTESTSYGIEVGNASLYDVTGQDQNQICELDSYGNTTIWQSLWTTAGATYDLSFLTAWRDNSPYTKDDEILAYWNGNLVADITPTWNVMQLSSYTVTAPTNSSVLTFVAGGASNTYGDIIDGVQVTRATPELSSGALLLFGMLPVGLGWWRRRKS